MMVQRGCGTGSLQMAELPIDRWPNRAERCDGTCVSLAMPSA